MDEKMESFLKEGILRYREAFNTIRTFEDNITKRLKDILKERTDWNDFLPDKASIRHTNPGRYYTWKNAVISGVKKSDNTHRELQIGITWDENDPYYFFANFSNDPTKFAYSQSSDKIQAKNAWATLLCIVPGNDEFDLDRDYNLVLDELLKYI